VVRAFYTALAHADGTAAAEFVVPENRKGHFDPKGITDFYSNVVGMQVSVVPNGENSYQAAYSYRTTRGYVCNNIVAVAVIKREEKFMIQNTKPLFPIDRCVLPPG
jgi:hypothetical protein